MTDVLTVREQTTVTVVDEQVSVVTIPGTTTVITVGTQGPEGIQGSQGEQGIQGPPGALGSDANYVHVQNAPSTTWTVDHALGKYPAIQVIDSAGTVVMGDIEHVSLIQAILRFSAVFSGLAVCN